MTTVDSIKKNILPILRKYDICRAGIFGSFARKLNTKASDVDILIELKQKISLLEFVKIKLDLEDKLNKKVDLVEYNAIKPQLKDRILSEEIRIYG